MIYILVIQANFAQMEHILHSSNSETVESL